jgi:ABC-2 type transport system ATP-binding protein
MNDKQVFLEVKDLCLNLNRRPVLRNLDATFYKGETVLIAGRNGVGKSSFLRCLAGSYIPDSGHIHFAPNVSKRKVASIIGRTSLLEDMTLAEAIKFHSRVYDVKRFDDSMLQQVGLGGERKIRQLSTGERVIFHMSLLVSQEPELLLVDEVVHSIDPFLRDMFMETMIGLVAEFDTTILMVNHSFSDIQNIPERMLLMNEGRFVIDEQLDELKTKVRKVSLDGDISSGLPVVYNRETDLFKEFVIYPFTPDMADAYSQYQFQEMELEEIIKAFIGGFYVNERV